jgi:hypothetical protein
MFRADCGASPLTTESRQPEMRAETEVLVDENRQAIALLRRHL